MHKIALTAGIVALGLIATSSRAEDFKASKDHVAGKWVGKVRVDEKALKEDPAAKTLTDAEINLMMALFTKMSMTFDFAADGKASLQMDVPGIAAAKKKQTGTWEVVKTDGNKLTVKTTSDDPEEKVKDSEFKFVFKDAKSFSMKMPEGTTVPKWIEFNFTKK